MWTTVELREIRTFLVLAETLHFGRAGEQLGLTPSRVSQTIRGLETRVGGRLFARNSRRVALTPLGEQFLRRIEPAYAGMQAAFTEAREAAAGLTGRLRIGTYTPINLGPRFGDVVAAFETRHPGCKVDISETGFDREQFSWLRAGELDMLAMRLPVAEPEVTIGPVLSREPRVAVVARGHPLARRDAVRLDDLVGYDVSYSSRLPRAMMDALSPPHTASGRPLRRVDRGSISDVVMRVAAGVLVHPSVPSFLDHVKSAALVAVPLAGLPASESALVWLTAREDQAVRAFARVAADVIAIR